MDLSGANQPKPLIDRVKSIIITPKDEWPLIAAEPDTITGILKRHVLPLVAIGPVASFIGGQLFGYGGFGFSYKPSLLSGLSSALVGIALYVAMIFILMLIAEFLAPKFGGEANRLNAFKFVAYGATASWLAGIFGLIPSLAMFGLLGLYSLYLLYTGATPLMKVPQDKSGGYLAVMILAGIVLALLIAPITIALTGLSGMGASIADREEASGTLTLPGGNAVDVGKLEQMGKQMERAAAGNAPAIPPARMQELLPASIGAYQRTATETLATGPMGSTAQGTYTAGDKSFTLMVADMSALGAIAGLGAAFGVEQSREDADSYERTGAVDGQMQTEAWNKTQGSGKFSKMIASRFMVSAEGGAASIDELKAAVATIDPTDLTDLAE